MDWQEFYARFGAAIPVVGFAAGYLLVSWLNDRAKAKKPKISPEDQD